MIEQTVGQMEKERRTHTDDVLLEAGAIEKEIDTDEAFTMQFLEETYGQTE